MENKKEKSHPRPVPIYTTRGDLGAFLLYPYLFDLTGEWIGWVTPQREVYSIYGRYVGWLSDDPRILRKRGYDFSKPRKTPPKPPPKFTPPAMAPLAPMMSELSMDTIDVLEEKPELLPAIDFGEVKADLE